MFGMVTRKIAWSPPFRNSIWRETSGRGRTDLTRKTKKESEKEDIAEGVLKGPQYWKRAGEL